MRTLALLALALLAGAVISKRNRRRSLSENKERHDPSHSDIIVLGCGSSTGVPRPLCLIQGACKVCKDAWSRPRVESKNYRGNPSLLVRFLPPGATDYKNIVIDVGKTFNQSALTWFPHHQVPRVDAVIITHGHADAIMGMDDLRGMQQFTGPLSVTTADIPIYLAQDTMTVVHRMLPYLVDTSKIHSAVSGEPISLGASTSPIKTEQKQPTSSSSAPLPPCKPASSAPVPRRVAQLSWHVIQPFKSFVVEGLRVTPLPLIHGEDYISLGFVLGERDCVVYLSDVSRIPDDVMDYLKQLSISVLFIDALFKEVMIPVHFSLPQALAAIKELKPKRALLTGMSDQFDYYVDNEAIRQSIPDCLVEMAHDGLKIPLVL